MKIGIITVHDSANFGSILQAFALKTFLEQQGHSVVFVKTRGRNKVREIFFGKFAKDKKKYIKNFRNNFKKYSLFISEINLFKEIEYSKVNDSDLDLVVIGSDELWNLNTPVFTNEWFYGAGISKRKITYAVSCGNCTAEKFKGYPELTDHIKELEAVTVRDTETSDLVREITGLQTPIVCDPTFLIDPVMFDKKKFKNPFKQKFLLLYSYSVPVSIRQHTMRFCHENNLLCVSVCMNNPWADVNIQCSPFEFCSLLSQAEYVVTTTFHGTIFSVLNKKKFLSIPYSQKVENVLNDLSLTTQIMNENDDYEKFSFIIKSEPDYDQADSKIYKFREKSVKVLETVADI
ncbi:MAG: polysaccharide pyruvyl transferase family protein [Oscillospiraceae bacterium]|nr:polysaccharide pyruvyl transferase family protein [Oscillospiraceae bacterium]